MKSLGYVRGLKLVDMRTWVGQLAGPSAETYELWLSWDFDCLSQACLTVLGSSISVILESLALIGVVWLILMGFARL